MKLPSLNSVVFTALVTMAVMFAANQAAGRVPTLRRFIRGTPVSPVGDVDSGGSPILPI